MARTDIAEAVDTATNLLKRANHEDTIDETAVVSALIAIGWALLAQVEQNRQSTTSLKAAIERIGR
jgi:hypothetical protein